MGTILLVISGFFFLLAYFEIIRLGFRDKTYGMPIPALLASISWEFIYTFIHPLPGVQVYVNFLWFAFDVVIFYQLLRYWRTEIKDVSPMVFYPAIFVFLTSTFLIILFMANEFNSGGEYSGFAAYFMMTVLFVLMFYRRKGLRGQSVMVPVYRIISNATATLFLYRYDVVELQPLLILMFFLTLFFDLVYLTLVYLQAKKKIIFPEPELKITSGSLTI